MDPKRRDRFRDIFMKHYPWLCQVAYGYVHDSGQSEDIVQEAFITMWDRDKENLPEKEFTAYIMATVKNSCISYLRKRKIETTPIDDHSGIKNLAEDDSSEAARAKDEEKVAAALQALPEKCREIFILSRVEDLKYKDIATRLNISVKTVENQMGKALRTLREYAAGNSMAIILAISLLMLIFRQK